MNSEYDIKPTVLTASYIIREKLIVQSATA